MSEHDYGSESWCTNIDESLRKIKELCDMNAYINARHIIGPLTYSSGFNFYDSNKKKNDPCDIPFKSITPVRILHNDPATIVFWDDGTKTIVKRAEGQEHNPYFAFCSALAKKIFGNNSSVNKLVGFTEEAVKKNG